MGKAILIGGSNEPIDSITYLLENLRAGRAANKTTRSQIKGFRETMANSPRATSAYNRARRRAVAVTDDIIALFERIESQTIDVEQALEQVLENRSS
jgi:hypothetical protein